MYKLIVSDMDGTLLNSRGQISEENVRAIKVAQRNGIKFAIASGRSLDEIKPVLKKHEIVCPIIALNGGKIELENGKNIFTKYIPKEDVIKVCKKFDSENIVYILSDGYRSITKRTKNPLKDIMDITFNEKGKSKFKSLFFLLGYIYKKTELNKNIVEYLENEDFNVMKILVLNSSREKLNILAKELNDMCNVNITSSYKNNIEVLHKDVDKANAISILTEHLEINMENVMAFGDNLNDLNMIREVGLGVAMGNGLDEVKSKAKLVTKTNEEHGVAYIINSVLNNA